MKMPHPLLLDDLCRIYGRTHTRDDLISWWTNATRHFDLMPEYMGDNEPAEVTAARALWIHSNLDPDPQSRTEYGTGVWSLVSTFTTHHAKMRAQHRGELI